MKEDLKQATQAGPNPFQKLYLGMHLKGNVETHN